MTDNVIILILITVIVAVEVTGQEQDEAANGDVVVDNDEIAEFENSDNGDSQNGNTESETSENGDSQNGNTESETSDNGDPQNGNTESETSENGDSQNGNTESETSDNGDSQNENTESEISENGDSQNGNTESETSDNGDSQNENSESETSENGESQNENSESETSDNGDSQNENSESETSDNGESQNENTESETSDNGDSQNGNTESETSENGDSQNGNTESETSENGDSQNGNTESETSGNGDSQNGNSDAHITEVNQEQLKGTDANISCNVTNLRQQLAEVKWRDSEGYEVASSVSGTFDGVSGTFDASSSSQTTTLSVAGVDNIKDTTYKCLVRTTADAAWQEATVHLKVFTATPTTKLVTTAVDQTLSCTIGDLDANHPVYVTWTEPDGGAVSKSSIGEYYEIDDGEVDKAGIQHATLTIKEAKMREFSGQTSFVYTCSVRSVQYNTLEPSPSSDIVVSADILTLNVEPVSSQVEDGTATTITTITISCVVSGLTKELDGVGWVRRWEGVDVNIENKDENGYWVDKGTFEAEAGRQITSLEIPVSTIRDGDVFACVIQSDEHGKTKEAPERKVVHTRCEAGSYRSISMTVCEECPPGNQANPEQTQCDSCYRGSYRDDSMMRCEVCPPGTEADQQRSQCEACREGFYKDSTYTECEACPTNQFSLEGAEHCTPCPSGAVVNQEQSQCVQSCSENQYQCQDKSGCIPSTKKCDGVKHCPDSSDETPPTCIGGGTTAEETSPACPPLPPPDGISKLTCSSPTRCTYSCINPLLRFYTSTYTLQTGLVSEMEVTCNPATSQWSHMGFYNPFGVFPSCRETFGYTLFLEWTGSFSPSSIHGDEDPDRPSRSTTTCPTNLTETVRSAFYGVEKLQKIKFMCKIEGDESDDHETTNCFYIRDGGKCTVLDDVSLLLTFFMGVQLPGNENNNKTYITVIGDALNQKFYDIAFNITVDGTKFTDNNDLNMVGVKNDCKYGHVLMDGETPCVPCDRGEFYDGPGCSLCPRNQYNSNIGMTECEPCSGSDVTPREGSVEITSCVPPTEVCTVLEEPAGRRSPTPGTKVTTQTPVQTFCQNGYSLKYGETAERTCEFLTQTDSTQQCFEVCTILSSKNKDVEYYYYTNSAGERRVYRKDYLMYNQVIQVQGTCFGAGIGELFCHTPGSEIGVPICQDGTNGTVPKACASEREISAVFGDYNWPETEPGTNTTLPCQHTDEFNAKKFCSSTGKYRETDFSSCPSSVAPEINDIFEEVQGVTTETQDDISEKIKETTAYSGGQMSSQDVEKTADIIDDFLDAPDIELSLTTIDNLIKTVDNVQTNAEEEEMRKEGTSDKFRESAVKIVGEIAKRTEATFVPMKSVGFAVAEVTEVDTIRSVTKNLLVLTGETNVIEGSNNEEKSGTNTYFKAELSTSENEVATAVYYETDKSFPSTAVSTGTTADESFQTVAKKLVAETGEVSLVATVISDINIVDRSSSAIIPLGVGKKVTMKFQIKDETEKKVHSYTRRKTLVTSKLSCKYYDSAIEVRDWSEAGCETETDDALLGETGVTCSCDHLTSFAVLMSFTKEENDLEELVSHILLGISLFCLLLTLAAILPNKKSLKMKSVRVNLMLIIALIFSIVCFFLMDLFVETEDDIEPSIPCSIIAFLLNYFWLCQLSWMIVEAATMYLALVKVFGTYISRAMLKYSLVGWGAPLVFPLIAVAWGRAEFADPKTCFIKYPYGLATFYAPVVLGVLVNWVLFFFIVRVILVASKNKAQKMGDSNVKMRQKQLQSALAVSTLLGLSWIIGSFLLVDNRNYSTINIALRWLFTLLNAPQGIFIFLFYVVLKEDTRNFWLQKFKRQKKKVPGISYTGVDSKGQKKKDINSTTAISQVVSNQSVMNTQLSITPNITPYTTPQNTPLLTPRHVTKPVVNNTDTASALSVEIHIPVSSSKHLVDSDPPDGRIGKVGNLEVESKLSGDEVSRTSSDQVEDERIYFDPDEINLESEEVKIEMEHSFPDNTEVVDIDINVNKGLPAENEYTINLSIGDSNTIENVSIEGSESKDVSSSQKSESVENVSSLVSESKEDTPSIVSESEENVPSLPSKSEEDLFSMDNESVEDVTSRGIVFIEYEPSIEIETEKNAPTIIDSDSIENAPSLENVSIEDEPVVDNESSIEPEPEFSHPALDTEPNIPLKRPRGFKSRVVQVVAAMLFKSGKERKSVKDKPSWISLNKARKDDAEEAEDKEDDYHGLRLNKFGNFNEVTIMEEKDKTIERKLKSQLKRVESGQPVIVEEDQYEAPKLKQVTPLEETEETIELNELENKLEKQLERIDSEKHPGDNILDDSEKFDHKGERLETEELSSKLEEQLKKIELGEDGLLDISQSDEEKHNHKGEQLESEELETKLKERLKKINSGEFLDT
ncbi:uncharacterized protein LOC134819758 [Bolinopsis microptera]|uniref:uncharacterized protein LOC134819758 n=1 Tax=Bolinopsis microptera TaxID=2820187 RepID=UPI00307AE24D